MEPIQQLPKNTLVTSTQDNSVNNNQSSKIRNTSIILLALNIIWLGMFYFPLTENMIALFLAFLYLPIQIILLIWGVADISINIRRKSFNLIAIFNILLPCVALVKYFFSGI